MSLVSKKKAVEEGKKNPLPQRGAPKEFPISNPLPPRGAPKEFPISKWSSSYPKPKNNIMKLTLILILLTATLQRKI